MCAFWKESKESLVCIYQNVNLSISESLTNSFSFHLGDFYPIVRNFLRDSALSNGPVIAFKHTSKPLTDRRNFVWCKKFLMKLFRRRPLFSEQSHTWNLLQVVCLYPNWHAPQSSQMLPAVDKQRFDFFQCVYYCSQGIETSICALLQGKLFFCFERCSEPVSDDECVN